MSADRDAVLTGMGALSPLGSGVAAFWEGLVAGRVALGPIRGFDTTGCTNATAAEVRAFAPHEVLGADEVRRLDRLSQFALVATREALADSRLDLTSVDSARVGVVLATTLGGMLLGEAYHRRPPGDASDARQLLHMPYYAVSNRIARELGVRGPVASPSIACASGTHAIGMGLDLIRVGHADVIIAGGVETLCPFVVHGFNCLRATASSGVVRPFDAGRDGLLLGEGAAIVIVEAAEHAIARGVHADVEAAGAGLSGDAAHITAPARDGGGAARSMQAALDDAGTTAGAVDFISAHGTGTVYNDAMENVAISGVLGPRAAEVPVNSIKGAIGHTLAAAGTFEAIMSVGVLRTGIIPPTANCATVDPACQLDIVRAAPRKRVVHTVLSTSSAFAGNNAALVLRSWREG